MFFICFFSIYYLLAKIAIIRKYWGEYLLQVSEESVPIIRNLQIFALFYKNNCKLLLVDERFQCSINRTQGEWYLLDKIIVLLFYLCAFMCILFLLICIVARFPLLYHLNSSVVVINNYLLLLYITGCGIEIFFAALLCLTYS